MATNYRVLVEEIRMIYSRGIDREDISPRTDSREIKIYTAQAINSLIKAETSNNMEVPDTVLASYDVNVTTEGCNSFAILPAFPVNLPKNMGIHRVYPSGCPWKPYIPIKNGDFDIAQGTPTETLEGQTGYYQDGKRIYFTKKITGPVIFKLVVNDPNSISDTDILPIPPEMETLVIDMVLARLGSGQISQYELNSKSEQSATSRQIDS